MSIGEEIAAHDAALRARGLEIWIGAEPTFTRRDAQEPAWLWQAQGGDKETRAIALRDALARLTGGVACAAAGRQYPEEPAPRFAHGLRLPTGLLTVTPDPGVVEVNMAPAPDAAGFLAQLRAVYAAAAEAGLSPFRWRWNGQVADSGGGGQVTLGGPSAEASPFFRAPSMLPGMLRYLNRHPSLSYWFATECVGGASQGPRPDEGARERFDELAIALARLDASPPGPERLWAALAPLLVDGAGNSHRAELNVEKLWNPCPFLEGRGKLGLVELRALRMAETPERLAAIGCLFRAVAARAIEYREPLADWGAALHDRFALPLFLEEDLREVLADLEAAGLGLGPDLAALVLSGAEPIARVPLGRAALTITPALEFWPLVGDVASQERAGARLVDSSSERLQLVVDGPPGDLAALGFGVPLRASGPERHVGAVRRRAFAPDPGFHPGLGAQDPLELVWRQGGDVRAISLHSWIPGGGAYPGLPADATEAARRRRERVVIREATWPASVRAGVACGHVVDLRAP
jgi:uncharacterized protein (DUF2126 family)